MKALILVGGYGTRLRPLTFSQPKPLVPFANKAIVLHQIEALAKVGVKKIVLAVNYLPEVMDQYLKGVAEELKVEIVFSLEDVPLGTAGPVALAKKHLQMDDEPFFMFNSDVICSFPLQELLTFHKAHGGEGTILVTKVKDPSKYGVVISDSKGKISQFVEKPQEYVSDDINAGMYLLNPSVCNRIKPEPTSIERDIFPQMAAENKLYCMNLPGYWMDIGQPKDYLIGARLHLKYLADSKQLTNPELKGVKVVGNVMVHPSAQIGQGSVIGPNVIIGADVVIEAGACVRDSTLFEKARVKSHAWVSSSIIGWESTIGSWARVKSCIIGKDVQIGDEVYCNEITVCPHKGIKSDEPEPKIVM